MINALGSSFSFSPRYIDNSQRMANSGLERSPMSDAVSFKAKKKEDEFTAFSCKEADMLRYDVEYTKPSLLKGSYEILGDDLGLKVNKKTLAGRDIVGNVNGKDVNINISSGALESCFKGTIKGSIDNKPIELKYRGSENYRSIRLAGNHQDIDSSVMPALLMVLTDKIRDDKANDDLIATAIVAS